MTLIEDPPTVTTMIMYRPVDRILKIKLATKILSTDEPAES